jgi:hypothetical protein
MARPGQAGWANPSLGKGGCRSCAFAQKVPHSNKNLRCGKYEAMMGRRGPAFPVDDAFACQYFTSNETKGTAG